MPELLLSRLYRQQNYACLASNCDVSVNKVTYGIECRCDGEEAPAYYAQQIRSARRRRTFNFKLAVLSLEKPRYGPACFRPGFAFKWD
jgi:hypothetical protein